MINSNNRQITSFEGDIPYDLSRGVELPGEDGKGSSFLPFYDEWLPAEAQATRIYGFNCTLPVLGLITTPDCIRNYLDRELPDLTPAQRDGAIDLKMNRQDHLRVRNVEQIFAVGERIVRWAARDEPRLARSFVNRIESGNMTLVLDDYTRYFGDLMFRNVLLAEGPDEEPLAIHAERSGGVAPVVLKPGDIGFSNALVAVKSLFDDDLIPFQSTERPKAGSVFYSHAELRAWFAGVKDGEFDYLIEEPPDPPAT